MFLKDFQMIRPKYEMDQKNLLDWIIHAHAHAKKLTDGEIEPSFIQQMKEQLFKIGLGEDKIKKRGFSIQDTFHQNWKEMEIYNLTSKPEGYHLDKRMALFGKYAMDIFEKLYPQGTPLPSHLIHTTCTGYVAPSPAQRIISKHTHGEKTTVTHAYHMGCYSAIPSIRIAMGHYMVENTSTDIVHTELCSLHMNPTLHSTEQLVVQSLFGDGFIKYCLGGGNKGLKIISILEEIIGNSTEKMTWNCHPWGFQMSLSKDIPILIRRCIENYLSRLAKKASISNEELKRARFAIHPGGPKIIDQIQEKLALNKEQIRHSKEVLQNYGNMSSATLPHVWDRILKDKMVQSGEKIVSMAFGPGLSISGALFEVKK